MAIGKHTTSTQTEDTLRPDWVRLLEMHWPRTSWLQEPDFSFAMRHLYNSLKKLPTELEMVEIVTWLAGPESNQRYSPSLREFTIAIHRYRRSKNADNPAYADPSTAFMGDVKNAMLKSGSWLERWNIMIQPSHYAGMERDSETDEILSINAWACAMWPQWEEQTAIIKRNMAVGIRQAINNMMQTGIRNEAKAYYAERAA